MPGNDCRSTSIWSSRVSSAHGETNPEMLFAEVLKRGRDLKFSGREEEAASLFASLQDDRVPETIRLKAATEFQAMTGQGRSAYRVEYLLGRILQQSTDSKTIVPMILGTTAYGVLRAASAARLAGSRFLASSGAGFAPTLIGFAGEVSVFALASRSMRHGAGEQVHESVGAEIAGAALSLGALKLFLHAGKALAVPALTAHTAGRASRALLFPSLSFLGLLTARRLETHFGFLPPIADATLVTDTFASLASLAIGRRLGQAVLGRSFAAFQQETFLRSPARISQASSLTPAWAMMGMGERLPQGNREPGKAGGTFRLPESMTIPELKYHVEQGSKSHARELVKRGETDPEAVQALREAIRVYREALEKVGMGDNFVRGNPSFYSQRSAIKTKEE